MKRIDRVKLNFLRNWHLPGKERLSRFFKPSANVAKLLNDGIILLNEEDIAIYTTADNYIECTLLTTGTYETEIRKLINTSLAPGNNCLDVGGNIGLQAIRMAKAVGADGQVIAFEPLIHLQQRFKKNVDLNCQSNVVLLPYALSDVESKIELNVDLQAFNQGTFSLTNLAGASKQNIDIKKGDDVGPIKHLDSLALIKIDVEGFEMQVMQGLKTTIAKHRPRIIFEYDTNYWEKTGQKIADCFAFLTGLKYKIFQIHQFGCTTLNNHQEVVSGNLFCIPITENE